MKKIVLESFLSYRFLSGAACSPSGARAAFLSHTPCLAANRYQSSLWVYRDGGETRLGSRDDIREFLWLDEDTLLVSVDGGDLQTTLLSVNLGGVEQEFARLPCRASLAGRLRDGRIVLTVEERPERLEKLLHLDGRDREDALSDMVREDNHFHILDEYPFWFNGKGYQSGVRCGVCLLDHDQLEAITPPDFRTEGLSVSEDGTYIAFFGNEIATVEPDTHRVYVYNASKGGSPRAYAEEGLRVSRVAAGPDGSVWAAGRFIRGSGAAEPCQRLFLAPPAGQLTQAGLGEWSLGNLIGSDCRYGSGSDFIVREGALWFIATVDCASQVFRCVPEREPEAVTSWNGSVDSVDVRNGQLLAVAMENMGLQELYAAEMGGAPRALTRQNSALCRELSIVTPKTLTAVNAQGTEIHGFVLEPPGHTAGVSCPAILDIHGGPHTAYGGVFFHEMQAWANRGYYVLCCNPTGSAGRGNAFGAIDGAWGSVDYEDILAFTDAALEAFPDIDSQRLGVTGGSYGGYMTNWIVTHTNRFKAAATQRSISNLISFMGTSDCGRWFLRQNLVPGDSSPEAQLWDRSPIKYVDSAVTPTLILHSEEDQRCWYAEGLQMFTALRQNGVEARMILFKGENHELSRSGKPINRLKRLREITRWMDRFLKQTDAAPYGHE